MTISLVHEVFNNRRKERTLYSLTQGRAQRGRAAASISTSTSRRRRLTSRCCLFPCLSPHTLQCKCFSMGRTGWNYGLVRSHSLQTRSFVAAEHRRKIKILQWLQRSIQASEKDFNSFERDSVLLCCPGTPYVDHAGLKFKNLFMSQVLGLKMYATKAGSSKYFFSPFPVKSQSSSVCQV